MWENGLPNSASTKKKNPFALWNIGNHPKSIYSGRPYLWNAERLSINDYIHVNQINLMFYWIFSWISEKFDLCWQWYKDHRNICENINDFQVIIHDMQIFSCVSWDYWVLNCYVQYSEYQRILGFLWNPVCSHLFKEVYSLFKSRIIRFRKLGRGGLIATELEQIKKPEKRSLLKLKKKYTLKSQLLQY